MNYLPHLALAASVFVSSSALAQDEFDLDDFGSTSSETTVAEEKRALLDEDPDAIDLDKLQSSKRRVIKTLQRKNVLKINRAELGVGLGLVTNSPFVSRYILRVDGTYHLTEIAALQIEGGFSPNFGAGDYTAITNLLRDSAGVSPGISKIQFYGNATVQFAPIYGKVAIPGNKIINFDVFSAFGAGLVQTSDALETIDPSGTDPAALATRDQVHPALNYGGGVRVLFNKNVALRFGVRGLSYIEVLNGTSLEMKNNLLAQASFSYFLGKGD